MATEIRKVLISKFGDVSNVNVITDSINDPEAGHIQVRVFYSGFGGADIGMRLGRYPQQKAAPLTPGYCFVGKVAKLGSGTSAKLKVDDVVAGLTVYDSEAELINQPEKYTILVPSELDLQKVCALILDWTTAYGMVMRSGKVRAGQTVFIHGLSGAVGNATAVLCQMQGAQIYSTASARNLESLKRAGCEPFVYTDKGWIQTMKSLGGADVVFDPLGFESWDESYSILSYKPGVLVGYGGNLQTMNSQETSQSRNVFLPIIKLLSRNIFYPFTWKWTKFYYITRDDKTFVPDLEALFAMLREGKIDVKVKAVFDIDNIKEAHESWGKPLGIGSMLIKVGAN